MYKRRGMNVSLERTLSEQEAEERTDKQEKNRGGRDASGGKGEAGTSNTGMRNRQTF